MNRNEEYAALRQAMEGTPPRLEYAVRKALARKSAFHKKRLIFGVPAGSLAVCCVTFILLVNLFPPFARACGSVPVLRELAKAVAWSPSLSAAVEDEYVQPMDQEQTENGVTARVEYVIVDRKQVNIFYTLTGDTDRLLEADATISGAHGVPLEGYSISSASYGTPNGELRQVDVNFVDRDMPDSLDVTLQIYQSGWDTTDSEAPATESVEDAYFTQSSHEPDYLAQLTFTLAFDPYFTAQGKIVPVEQTFQLDGQTLTLNQAEIYPTHLRLDFGYAADNTAWLSGLEFYVENERGERFSPITNGITASGEEASPSMVTYWMDTTYFSDSKSLTLSITQARWLEKDRDKIWLNLETGAHDPLPDGAEVADIRHSERGYLLTFREKMYREGLHYSLWQTYTDAAGTEKAFLSSGSSSTWQNPETGVYEDGSETGISFETVPLTDYHQSEVWLTPVFTHVIDFTDPVTLDILPQSNN